MELLPEDINDEAGAGSRSAIEDKKTGDLWDTKDQRAGTHTTFYQSDIQSLDVSQSRKQQLERILRYQEGEHVNSDKYASRGSQNHEEDKRRLVGSMTAKLGLTDHQKRRTKHIVLDVVSVNRYGNYSTEEVVLGVITYVCMEDMGANGVHVDDRDDFHELVESVDTTMERVKGARQITRRRLMDS
jgi:hypothetical protein